MAAFQEQYLWYIIQHLPGQVCSLQGSTTVSVQSGSLDSIDRIPPPQVAVQSPTKS